MIQTRYSAYPLLLCIILSSCSVKQQILQSELVASDDPTSVYILEGKTVIRAANAAKTTLRPGTKWLHVGTIEQGDVFRTKDQVVVVNSYNVHEAYVVVQDGIVVGYYLAFENTFVKSKPVKIKLIKKGA